MKLKKFTTEEKFQEIYLSLKLTKCPHCHRVGFFILHGYLRGLNESRSKVKKAKRIFCSNRGNKEGCGHTYSIYLLPSIPYLKVSLNTLWQFLELILNGHSIEKAFYALGVWIKLSLCTFLRIWYRFKRNHSQIRTFLHQHFKLQLTPTGKPIQETIHHIKTHLSDLNLNPIEAFISKFQVSIV